MMLQQTQVSRAVPYFVKFIERFPDFSALSNANLADVYAVWQGLGYNRRARFLLETAQMIVGNYHGRIPDQVDQLIRLPGIGKNTAGAIVAYSFNAPVYFIETNVRAVYLYHFFADETEKVTDSRIMERLVRTLDKTNPREFYWALMDYGTYLKKNMLVKNAQSAHYVRQSKFEGSVRQLRGAVLAALSERSYSLNSLKKQFQDPRLDVVLEGLEKDKMVRHNNGSYFIG